MERSQKAMQLDIMRQQAALQENNEFCAKEQVNVVAKQKAVTQPTQKRATKKVSSVCSALLGYVCCMYLSYILLLQAKARACRGQRELFQQ